MGFGTVAANVILFIGVLSVAGGFVILMNTYASQTSSTISIQKNQMLDEINTDIKITSTYYSSSENRLTMYVENSGKTDLIMNNTDIYISGERISRNDMTITKEPDTQVSQPPIWSPKEVIKIVIDKSLDSGENQIKIFTNNGVSAEDSISV